MADSAGRTSRRFRKLAANLRARRRPCCLCSQPIDYTLSWPHPQSFSVQHLKSWRDHPHLREDPGNLDACHLGCNASEGNRDPKPSLGSTSRDW